MGLGIALKGTLPARTIENPLALPGLVSRYWSYPVAEKRDLRLDFLRGFAVFAMIVDHFGGASWLYLITGGNAFFVSAAEGFIFISGLVVGMVYGGIALKEGIRSAQVKALRRAWTLYKLSVALTLLFTAFSSWFNLPWAAMLNNTGTLSSVLDIITFRQTFYLSDVMLMYTFLMVAAAGALWLCVKRQTVVLLSASAAVWLWFQIAPSQAQIPWPVAGNTTFNLAAWQLLFFVAMAIGFHRQALAEKLGTLPRAQHFAIAGVLLVWLMQLYQTNGAWLHIVAPGTDVAAVMHALFAKSALAPGRLVASAIVFQFAYLAATVLWRPLYNALGWLLMPLGQNALYAYTVHVGVVGLAYLVLSSLPGQLMTIGNLNTSLQLLAVLLIWAMIRRGCLFNIIPR